jgi:hypothetical protein
VLSALAVRDSNFHGPVPAMAVVPAHVIVERSASQPVGHEFCVTGSLAAPPTNAVGESMRSGRMYESSCRSG